MSTKGLRRGVWGIILVFWAHGAPGQDAVQQLEYRVNYRPADADPWQIYAQAGTQDKANAIANEVRLSGYQAQVVDTASPLAQPFPNAAATSASRYYPTSNWANDYNYYMMPSGSNYGYNWYGGWYPWNRHHVYPNYMWGGGNNWNSGWYRGHGWNTGWNRGYGAQDGWNESHRNWNSNHADRGSHSTYAERHANNAHQGNAANRATTGHHTAGQHAAAAHAAHHSAAHRGTGHFATGGRTSGHRAGGHRAGGHAFHGARGGGRRTGGRHASGHHASHLDP